jgi:hypothetical protein
MYTIRLHDIYVVIARFVSGGGIRDGIFKLLRSPGIHSKESIPPAYVTRRAGTTTLIPTRFLVPIDCSKILAQEKLISYQNSTLYKDSLQG